MFVRIEFLFKKVLTDVYFSSEGCFFCSFKRRLTDASSFLLENFLNAFDSIISEILRFVVDFNTLN